MTEQELMSAARQLSKQGYLLSIDADSINVSDPVQCSSGIGKWTEYEMVKLTTVYQVQRFISARS